MTEAQGTNGELQYSIPQLRNSKACERCGKTFFQTKKTNCYNCGVQLCVDCMYALDEKGLKGLSIKTLKRYLQAYNINTHGMLEKDELIKAIMAHRPIPEVSEVYFRTHTPETVDEWASLHDEFTSGTAASMSGGSYLDKFFAKLRIKDDALAAKPQAQSSSQQRPEPGAASAPASKPTGPVPSKEPKTPPSTPPRPHSVSQPQQKPQAHPQAQQQSQQQQKPQIQSTGAYPYPHMQTPPKPEGTSTYTQVPPPPKGPYWTRTMPTPNIPRYNPSGGPLPFVPPTAAQQQAYGAHSPGAYPPGVYQTSSQPYQAYPVYSQEIPTSYHTFPSHQYPQLGQEKLKSEQEGGSKGQASSTAGPAASTSASYEDDSTCKICYDAPLDCVMLNCGHLSTCMDCGKQIMDKDRACPICREYILKLLQVFRA
ncbi:hypothetical protein BC939DRAFT_479233 [Gamsiella multidivaricata]|uniref:uncharacterized protein n=1 Tax=Gamsiella multidivaricata TaxID=101098 RepID=UPI00221E678E|nr:uncharacterized protein BC939DRAFT_479233 [Gamsiella multidivaricata]KAI7819897.1 hypothetical protein BC939DRAFT_479233 [Gamsiella multidivaricata]